MKTINILKPTLEILPIEDGSFDEYYCKLKVSPLDRGYGMTLGNSLRRVLLSSLPGAAALAIRIEGIAHEFAAIEGVREDVTAIILNMKKVVFTINKEDAENGDFGDETKIHSLKLNVSLPSIEVQKKAGIADEDLVYQKEITASEIDCSSEDLIEVVNRDQILFTITAGGSVNMDILVRRGVGYVNAKENKTFCDQDHSTLNGYITIDSIFTPVLRCKYEVSKTRHLNNFDCDQLILEVWTNGSMLAKDAICLASKYLVEHFSVIEQLNEKITNHEYMVEKEEKMNNEILDKKIEDLNLSVRSYHCLKRAGINTVGELAEKSEEEMMKVKNLGRKSLKEVVLRLHEEGLGLKNSSINWDDEEDEEQNKDSSENE